MTLTLTLIFFLVCLGFVLVLGFLGGVVVLFFFLFAVDVVRSLRGFFFFSFFFLGASYYGFKDSVAFLTWLVPILFCFVLFFAGGKIWIGEYYGGRTKKKCFCTLGACVSTGDMLSSGLGGNGKIITRVGAGARCKVTFLW